MNFKEIIAISIAAYQILLPRVLTIIAAIIIISLLIKFMS